MGTMTVTDKCHVRGDVIFVDTKSGEILAEGTGITLIWPMGRLGEPSVDYHWTGGRSYHHNFKMNGMGCRIYFIKMFGTEETRQFILASDSSSAYREAGVSWNNTESAQGKRKIYGIMMKAPTETISNPPANLFEGLDSSAPEAQEIFSQRFINLIQPALACTGVKCIGARFGSVIYERHPPDDLTWREEEKARYDRLVL